MTRAMQTLFGVAVLLAVAWAAHAGAGGEATPTGQTITPTAAPGAIFQPLNPELSQFPDHLAGQASALALSPDGRTLLIATSGYNLMFGDDGKPIPTASMEYVFVYDVSGAAPVKRQVIRASASTCPEALTTMSWNTPTLGPAMR
jgi:hypothetical protein